LAALARPEVKATPEDIAKSLEGNWREELLFVLKREVGFNRFYQQKRFDNAAVTISGIELAEKIKKGQFKTGKLGGGNATMTKLWNAALVA
jgi:hypothetical protein